MKKSFEQINEQGGLFQEERINIEAKADLRRRRQQFKIDTLNLKQKDEEQGEMEAIRQKREENLRFVFSKADGEQEKFEDSAKELSQKAEMLIQKAEEKAGLLPNLAAALYIRAAALKEAVGENFQDLIKKSKEQIEKTADIAKEDPLALLPDAILLGIQKRQLEKTATPAMEKIAKAAANDKRLLQDYALVLPEDKRQEFLNLLPEEKRREASIVIDRALSEVLSEKLTESEEEKEQRESI